MDGGARQQVFEKGGINRKSKPPSQPERPPNPSTPEALNTSVLNLCTYILHCCAQLGGNRSIRKRRPGFPCRACMKARRLSANGGTENVPRVQISLGDSDQSRRQIPADTIRMRLPGFEHSTRPEQQRPLDVAGWLDGSSITHVSHSLYHFSTNIQPVSTAWDSAQQLGVFHAPSLGRCPWFHGILLSAPVFRGYPDGSWYSSTRDLVLGCRGLCYG